MLDGVAFFLQFLLCYAHLLPTEFIDIQSLHNFLVSTCTGHRERIHQAFRDVI